MLPSIPSDFNVDLPCISANGQLHLVSSCLSFPFIEFHSIPSTKKNTTSCQVGCASSEKALIVKSIFRSMIKQLQNKRQRVLLIKPVLTSKQNNNCAPVLTHSKCVHNLCTQKQNKLINLCKLSPVIMCAYYKATVNIMNFTHITYIPPGYCVMRYNLTASSWLNSSKLAKFLVKCISLTKFPVKLNKAS